MNETLTAPPPLIVDTHGLDWQPSPCAGVWRKRIEHRGEPERGRVTSIVRFDPGARFDHHDHPEGEEVLVLEGVFRDAAGEYGPGHYVASPHGSSHAPDAPDGCTLLVKLRQMTGPGHRAVSIDTRAAQWDRDAERDIARLSLYTSPDGQEYTRLAKLGAGVRIDCHDHRGGEEVYVLEGMLCDEWGEYPRGTWVQFAHGSWHAPYTESGCTLFVRSGHLPSGKPPGRAG